MTLWREKRFDLVHDNNYITGIFDRVTILRDDAGQPVGATVLDYKSSQVDTDAGIEHKVGEYRQQMVVYRDALAQILGLPPDRIVLQLLFTRQQVVRVINDT